MKNDFEIRGDIVVIFLNRKDGSTLETIIDLADLDKMQGHKGTWFAHWMPSIKSFYAHGHGPVTNGKRATIGLHRFLMDTPKGLQVDHINHDTLNNTRENLRNVTPSVNCQNLSGAHKDGTSGRRGVHWNKKLRKWQAYLKLDYKYIHLGFYTDLDEASRIVHEARVNIMPGYMKKTPEWSPEEILRREG